MTKLQQFLFHLIKTTWGFWMWNVWILKAQLSQWVGVWTWECHFIALKLSYLKIGEVIVPPSLIEWVYVKCSVPSTGMHSHVSYICHHSFNLPEPFLLTIVPESHSSSSVLLTGQVSVSTKESSSAVTWAGGKIDFSATL